MMLGRVLNCLARATLAPLIFCAITAYFSWNAIHGAHGLVAYAQREVQLKQAEADLAAAKTERDKWEVQVSGLRSNHLDLDTLDERARTVLNLAQPNEIVVPYSSKNRLF